MKLSFGKPLFSSRDIFTKLYIGCEKQSSEGIQNRYRNFGPQGDTYTATRQMLSMFLHQRNILKKDSLEQCKVYCQNLQNLAHISNAMDRSAIEKLEQMLYKWITLQKDSKRGKTAQMIIETAFQVHADKLFGIAYARVSQPVCRETLVQHFPNCGPRTPGGP